LFGEEEDVGKGSADVYADAVSLLLHGEHYTKEAVGCQQSTVYSRVEQSGRKG
jgi:hypothetical protein